MIQILKRSITIILFGLLSNCTTHKTSAKQETELSKEIILTIKPSSTDHSITKADNPHLIMYNSSLTKGKLLLFLPGTNGIPEKGPKDLFRTAIQQGYRVINLSYIDKQAVAAICRGKNLADDADCTEKFREQRVFGTRTTSLIPDEPQDAIVNRFTKLLIYLNKTDPKGNWNIYLENGSPKWELITVSGQSQGGGMAAYIAKQKFVDKVITFSGGWDFSEKGKIAKWYYHKSITPPNRWFGIYHAKEPAAPIIKKTYKAMDIPNNQTYPLNLKIREGKRAHGEGIRNTAYKKLWIEILGNGSLN